VTKTDTTTLSFEALSVFRGIYKRVADQLQVDPSYVSRVARGERNAPHISDALRKEIARVLGKAGLHNGDLNGNRKDGHRIHNHNHNGASDGKRRKSAATTSALSSAKRKA
jgi:hypothetical protein